MNTVYEIVERLKSDNGSNFKMDVLRENSDNELLQRVLKMTYDKATFTYGITTKTLAEVTVLHDASKTFTLEEALDILEAEFVTREVTGNAAVSRCSEIMCGLSQEDLAVFMGVINRDLRINMGRSNINKVFKGLIVKPVYMRCGVYSEKTAKKFNPKGAFLQLKADGTYREFIVEGDTVTCSSRQGEVYDYPHINKILLETGVQGAFFGELTVYRDGELLGRAEGNGILKKSEIPDDCLVVFDCWDIVSMKEYNGAIAKVKGKVPYQMRFMALSKILPSSDTDPYESPVRLIETYRVDSIQDALKITAEIMNRGLEGTIIKEASAIFRDGTSNQQLKLKLEIDVEVRATGFLEGTPGTVREKTFGSITFETDDGLIKGRTSGFTNDQLEDFNSRREEIIGKIMTVTCNDITKGRDNDHHALSHPRFVEFRDDRDDTDTLERALESKQMAMMVDQ